MEEIKSGKELCDSFFESLAKRVDIDLKVANLFKDLYNKGNFTKDKLLQGLQSLRQDTPNEKQS